MNTTESSEWNTVQKKSKKEKMNIDEKKKESTTMATKHHIIKETITVEPNKIGFLAGRQGRNLKRLRENYGIRITLPPREGSSQVIIEGPAKMVLAAKMDIEENLSRKTRFFIEKDQFVLVIGNQGKNIQALEDTLNVEVYINRTNGQVTITGTRCEEAKKIIQENLSNVTSFSIGKEYRRLVLESISALEDAHNVKINSFEDEKWK